MNVLVIAPHPDDEAIGCGGAIRLHSLAGDRVAVIFLTSGERGISGMPPAEAGRVREAEAHSAAGALGVVATDFLRLPDGNVASQLDAAAAAVRTIVAREQPHRIYVPHPADGHPDHLSSWPVVQAAYRHPTELRPPTILGYEVWTPMPVFDDGINVTAVMVDKVRAIRCHASQVSLMRFDRGVRGLNRYRGAMAWACPYAEVFVHLFLEGGDALTTNAAMAGGEHE